MNKKTKKGFTIVELVIVIAVIAILAAVLIPTFSNVIQKAKTSNDVVLVRNLNTALATDGKQHNTMHDAILAAKDFGFDLPQIVAKVETNKILWDSKNDVFCYEKDGVVTYIPESNLTYATVNYDTATYIANQVNMVDLWMIANELDYQPKYSIYAGNDWDDRGSILSNLQEGFDVGYHTDILTINYNRTDATFAQNVVIRTNGGNLTINGYVAADGITGDEIAHYGEAGLVEIVKCAGHSYYENGKINNKLDVKQGHVVISEQAEVADVKGTGSDVSIDIVGATITGNIEVKDATLNISASTNISEDSLIYASGTATVESKTNTPIYTSGNTVDTSGSNVLAKTETVINYQSDWEAILVDHEDGSTKTIKEGVEFITLNCNISMSKVLVLTRSVTINGNGKSIENSAKRVMRVGAPNLTLNFINLNIVSTCTEDSDVRGISFDNTSSGSSLTLDGCSISVSFYAINIVCGPSNLNITIKNGTVAAGWAAINSYSNNSTFNVINSTLKGLNDKGESSWNDFATIVFDSNGLWSAANVGTYGSGNKLNISQSTVFASSESENNQAWLAIQYGSQNNNIVVDSLTKIIDDNDADQSDNITLLPFVGWQGTGYTASYNPNSLLIFGDEYIMLTYDGSLDDEALVRP